VSLGGKIEDLHELTAVGQVNEEDVLGLDVEVEHALHVRRLKPGRDARRDVRRAMRSERAHAREGVGEIAAGEELHHHVREPLREETPA
jgi:hypothetical protein